MTVLPVRETMCATCPFREGSKLAYLKQDLAARSLNEASRVCHSTGTNAVSGRTGQPSRICRGARDHQIQHYHRVGFIEAPTDEAWAKKLEEVKHRRAARTC